MKPKPKPKRRARNTSQPKPTPKTSDIGPERIEPGLLPLAVPIGSLKLWEANYRHGDVGAVSESLKRFGQKKPVVAQAGTGIVVAGNHVLKAAQALGWKRLAVVAAEMSDEDATAFAIADNRTSDLATNDDAQLTALLKRMMEDGGPDALVGTGYDGEDLDTILKHLAIQELGPEAFGALPDGPKGEFEQMTFTLHNSQADTVREAMDAAKAAGPFVDAPNENSNGNALARLAELALGALR